jgi:hypothetical protein
LGLAFFQNFAQSGTDGMIFKIFSPKNSAKKLAFLTENKAKLCKLFIITLVFEKNANFFRRKLSKIAENCDHNIDPWSHWRQATAGGVLWSLLTQFFNGGPHFKTRPS